MDFGKWKSEVLIPLAHRQVFHWTRSSLRRVSSSVLHVCGAKITKNHQKHFLGAKKLLVSKNNSYLCTVTIKWVSRSLLLRGKVRFSLISISWVRKWWQLASNLKGKEYDYEHSEPYSLVMFNRDCMRQQSVSPYSIYETMSWSRNHMPISG